MEREACVSGLSEVEAPHGAPTSHHEGMAVSRRAPIRREDIKKGYLFRYRRRIRSPPMRWRYSDTTCCHHHAAAARHPHRRPASAFGATRHWVASTMFMNALTNVRTAQRTSACHIRLNTPALIHSCIGPQGSPEPCQCRPDCRIRNWGNAARKCGYRIHPRVRSEFRNRSASGRLSPSPGPSAPVGPGAVRYSRPCSAWVCWSARGGMRSGRHSFSQAYWRV